MRIKAAVLPAPAHAVEVRDVDLAEPKAGEVLVRMSGSGVCASDLSAVDGKRRLVPYPAVLGHEAAGVVESVGPGAHRVSRGDHVVLTILPSLVTLYLEGELRLDELISRRIGLTDLNDAFDRLRAGTEARQVVSFDGSEVGAGAST
jgi:Zn-dependent alcohol dehydrogenase